MSQLAQLAQTLNALAEKTQTTPDDVIREAAARGDAFETVVGELDAHRRRAEADAQACAGVVAAAQRLKEATDARAAAFKAATIDVVEARRRAVAAEHDALIAGKPPGDGTLGKETAPLGVVGAGGACLTDRLVGEGRVDCLTEWAGKASATVVFDSTVDEFTRGGLFQMVKGKENIALVGFTTDGDVFGGFYSIAVTEQDKFFYDPTIFAFSFESHGRCMTPHRFFVKKSQMKKAFVKFWKTDKRGFVDFAVFAVGFFYLGNERSDSFCFKVSDAFDGLENTTLTGKDGKFFSGPYYHCTRLVAIQLRN